MLAAESDELDAIESAPVVEAGEGTENCLKKAAVSRPDELAPAGTAELFTGNEVLGELESEPNKLGAAEVEARYALLLLAAGLGPKLKAPLKLERSSTSS